MKMKQYLAHGMGVNSVALHLLMIREGFDFEALYVNHGTDWPETYHYAGILQWWLKANGHRPIRIIRPLVEGHDTLIGYYKYKNKLPSIMKRDCTDKFKIRQMEKVYEKPCFVQIGMDAGEAHRAKIVSRKNVENRYLLIEHGIDRNGCKKIIQKAGLPVPIKSGCFLCPFQRKAQWVELRRKHPCLFQEVVDLEQANMKEREANGLKPLSLLNNGKTISQFVNEDQLHLFEVDEYPPCQCSL